MGHLHLKEKGARQGDRQMGFKREDGPFLGDGYRRSFGGRRRKGRGASATQEVEGPSLSPTQSMSSH